MREGCVMGEGREGRERPVMREGWEREGGWLESLGRLWQPREDIWSLSLLTSSSQPDDIIDGLIFRWKNTYPPYWAKTANKTAKIFWKLS